MGQLCTPEKGSATPIELYKDTVGERFPHPGAIVDSTLELFMSGLPQHSSS